MTLSTQQSQVELTPFLRQYVETALWSSNDESDESGGDPMDKNYSLEDIALETLAGMARDCERFLAENAETLEAAYEATGKDETDAAHDFWLTRNGHGCGFWDGDWVQFGDVLDKACKGFGEVDLYVGDDGKVWG